MSSFSGPLMLAEQAAHFNLMPWGISHSLGYCKTVDRFSIYLLAELQEAKSHLSLHRRDSSHCPGEPKGLDDADPMSSEILPSPSFGNYPRELKD